MILILSGWYLVFINFLFHIFRLVPCFYKLFFHIFGLVSCFYKLFCQFIFGYRLELRNTFETCFCWFFGFLNGRHFVFSLTIKSRGVSYDLNNRISVPLRKFLSLNLCRMDERNFAR